MDKKIFVDKINQLGLEPKMKKALLDYLDSHELNGETVENMAKMLELGAVASDASASVVQAGVETLTNLQAKMTETSEKFFDDEEKANLAYIDDVNKMYDEIQPDSTPTNVVVEPVLEQPTQASMDVPADMEPMVVPVMDVAPVQPEVSQPVMTQPVMTPSLVEQPIQTQTQPVVQNPWLAQ